MRAIIIGLNSDIGYYLADRYSDLGYDILGTCRTSSERCSKYKAYPCDLRNTSDVDRFANNCLEWDLFISAVGDLKPVGKFFDVDFSSWEGSVYVNALAQLYILYKIYPYRDRNKVVDVVFFAGGGISKSVVDYSAYTLSKVMLVKMCEMLNDEYKDVNPFIIGPGWVKTKIHQSTTPNAYNYYDVVKFLNSNGGTPMEDIFKFIEQIRVLGKNVVGGRNFSIYDKLNVPKLREEADLFKLRRRE